MIETIYKVENSENSNNKKPDISIRLPKNIKQIGQGGTDMNCQIYIEENVLAYIKQKPYREKKVRYGILLGDSKQGNGYTYIFINGMVEVEEVIEDTVIFSDDIWTSIYDNIRRYYKEGIIVGWYGSFEGDITKDMMGIRKIHLDHFAGNNKVFLNINREDDEEAFYIYERNGLRKQPCYHVYFEKSYEFEDYIFGTGRIEEDIKDKPSVPKETGKYGIALNNSTSLKESGAVDKLKKEGERLAVGSLGKVASFVTILALAGILGIMGKNGGLDVLQDKVKGFVAGIINNDDKDKSTGNIIQVGGNPVELTTTSGTEENVSTNGEEQTTEIVATEGTTTESTTTESTTIEDSETLGNSESVTVDTEQETTTEKAQVTISGKDDTYASYIVKDGETLYSISMLFYGTPDKIDEIMALNDMKDENYIMEGQKILLP